MMSIFIDMDMQWQRESPAPSSGLITLFQCLDPLSRNQANIVQEEKFNLENITFYGDSIGRVIHGYICE